MKKEQALFEYDAKLSISEAIPMGLQHVVAAVVGIVTRNYDCQSLPIKSLVIRLF